MATSNLVRFMEELGLVSLFNSCRDTKLLCIQRFVRLFAYGGSTLILVAYLNELGISTGRIGLFMSLTLVGDTMISFVLTLFADALGRKAILAMGALLMAAAGVTFALFSNYWILLAAAIIGVISPRYAAVEVSLNRVLTRRTVEMKSDLSEPSKNRHSRNSHTPVSEATYMHGTP